MSSRLSFGAGHTASDPRTHGNAGLLAFQYGGPSRGPLHLTVPGRPGALRCPQWPPPALTDHFRRCLRSPGSALFNRKGNMVQACLSRTDRHTPDPLQRKRSFQNPPPLFDIQTHLTAHHQPGRSHAHPDRRSQVPMVFPSRRMVMRLQRAFTSFSL